MSRLRVTTVVGTRPEIIRLSRLIPKLDEFTDHVLVHTGQNYDRQLNDVFFEELELRQPDYYLNVDPSSFGSTMADTIRKCEEVFKKEAPDAVMILGDTNSSIAAVVAERLHIPVYHMEAGNRSFDRNVPEELNRRMVDHVSTFNLAYSRRALDNLIREGIHPKRTLVSGSPMAEVFSHFTRGIEASRALTYLNLEPEGYLVLSLHRQENVDDLIRLQALLDKVDELSRFHSKRVVFSVHPRTRKRIEVAQIPVPKDWIFSEPFGFFDYNNLQKNAYCVLSDSGSISEEAAILRFPAVTLRESMERPESLDAGSITMCGLKGDLHSSVAISRAADRNDIATDYLSKNFSSRVLGFLMSTARVQPRELSNL